MLSLFITKLYETFNGTQTLYFLLEPCLGGELYSTFVRKNLYGSEKHCKPLGSTKNAAKEPVHTKRGVNKQQKLWQTMENAVATGT